MYSSNTFYLFLFLWENDPLYSKDFEIKMAETETVLTEKRLILSRLMKTDTPFGLASYEALKYVDKSGVCGTTDAINFLCYVFADGTPDYPLGINKEYDGTVNDCRVVALLAAANKCESKEGFISSEIFYFIYEYLRFLQMPTCGSIVMQKLRDKLYIPPYVSSSPEGEAVAATYYPPPPPQYSNNVVEISKDSITVKKNRYFVPYRMVEELEYIIAPHKKGTTKKRTTKKKHIHN